MRREATLELPSRSVVLLGVANMGHGENEAPLRGKEQ
jgi:hypothetical protein